MLVKQSVKHTVKHTYIATCTDNLQVKCIWLKAKIPELSLSGPSCWGELAMLTVSCVEITGAVTVLVWVATVLHRLGCSVPPLGQASRRSTSILQVCGCAGLWPSTLLSGCGRAMTKSVCSVWGEKNLVANPIKDNAVDLLCMFPQ